MGNCRYCRWLVSLSLLLLWVQALPSASAQAAHHAALVVDFGDGRVAVRVVAFAGETISGVELLQQSGLNVALMVGLGGGTALCAVEGVGCPPTPTDCFCRCRGGACVYWSYFHLENGAWVYAPTGAADYVLRDGDVDGWVWGDGRTAPPVLTWDQIWTMAQPATPAATAAPSPLPSSAPPPPPTIAPTAPVVVSPTPAGTAAMGPTVPFSAVSVATAHPSIPTAQEIRSPSPVYGGEDQGRGQTAIAGGGPSTPGGGSSVAGPAPALSYGALAFAALVLVLLAMGWWVRRRG